MGQSLMKRNDLPIILMLVAGAVTCVITFLQNDSTLEKLVVLFIVLIVFYTMGTAIKWMLDEFDKRNAERNYVPEEEVLEEEEEEEE